MKEQSDSEQSQTLALDSTQTLRALTVREQRDPGAQKWFAVQLAVSDRPVNLEAMPRLELFSAYRLYAVEGHHGDASCYALRLGFFKDEKTAEVICGYVRSYFRSPSIVRVSSSERDRFERPASAAPPARQAARRGADVVDLSSVRGAAASNRSSPARKPAPASSKLKLDDALSRKLLEEARQVDLSSSGRHRRPQQPSSWVAKLLGPPKR